MNRYTYLKLLFVFVFLCYHLFLVNKRFILINSIAPQIPSLSDFRVLRHCMSVCQSRDVGLVRLFSFYSTTASDFERGKQQFQLSAATATARDCKKTLDDETRRTVYGGVKWVYCATDVWIEREGWRWLYTCSMIYGYSPIDCHCYERTSAFENPEWRWRQITSLLGVLLSSKTSTNNLFELRVGSYQHLSLSQTNVNKQHTHTE